MKKKILSVILLLALLSQALCFSGCAEEEEVPKTEAPEFTGDGSNIIKSELSGMSFAGLMELFDGALNAEADIDKLLTSYDISVAMPEKRNVILKNGLFSYTDNGTLMYAGTYKDEGLHLVSVTEDGSDYTLSEGILSGSTQAFDWLPKIKESLIFAGEHFDIPNIEDSDIIKGDDGIYYLGEGYTSELVLTVITAYRCISDGILPEELDDIKRTELSEYAREFAALTDLKLGFGLYMKRISSVKLVFSADGIKDYTGENTDSVAVDILLKLDSERKHLELLSGNISSKSEENADASASFNLSLVFDSEDKPVLIKLKLDSTLSDVVIGEEGADPKTPIVGERAIKLDLKFTPYSTSESIKLTCLEESRRSPDAAEAYRERFLEIEAGALSTKAPADVKISYSIDGEGISYVKPSFTGKVTIGDSVQAAVLPERVKELLGVAAE